MGKFDIRAVRCFKRVQDPEEKVESWWMVGSAEVTSPQGQFQKARAQLCGWSATTFKVFWPDLTSQARKVPIFNLISFPQFLMRCMVTNSYSSQASGLNLFALSSDCLSFLSFYLFIERDRQRQRDWLICCSTYLWIHWLILVCALTGDQTSNVGVSWQCSNQLSYRSGLPFISNSVFKCIIKT